MTLCSGERGDPNCTFSPSVSVRDSFRQQFRCSRASSRLETVSRVGNSVRGPCPVSELLYNSINFKGARITLHTTFGYTTSNGRYTVLIPAAVLTCRRCHAVLGEFSNFPIRVRVLSHFEAPGRRRGVLGGLGHNSLSVVMNARHLISGSMGFGSLNLLVISRRRHFNITRGRGLGRLFPAISILALSTAPVPEALGVTVANVHSVSMVRRTPRSECPIRACIVRRSVKVLYRTVRGRLHENNRMCCLRGHIRSVRDATTGVGRVVPSTHVTITRNQVNRRRLSRV